MLFAMILKYLPDIEIRRMMSGRRNCDRVSIYHWESGNLTLHWEDYRFVDRQQPVPGDPPHLGLLLHADLFEQFTQVYANRFGSRLLWRRFSAQIIAVLTPEREKCERSRWFEKLCAKAIALHEVMRKRLRTHRPQTWFETPSLIVAARHQKWTVASKFG
jgi:hypothetical protein